MCGCTGRIAVEGSTIAVSSEGSSSSPGALPVVTIGVPEAEEPEKEPLPLARPAPWWVFLVVGVAVGALVAGR